MTDRNTQDGEADERQLAEIIRHAGSRAQPPAAVRKAVREAALAEWRSVVASRARRRTLRWSMAAAAAAAGLAVWLAPPLVRAPAPVVASVTRVDGPVHVGSGRWFAGFEPLRSGGAVLAAAEIRSGPGGRVALRVGGNSVRMDENSAMAMVAPGRIGLMRGALYVDSGPEPAASSPLVVETAFGSLEHLGTQYEARVSGEGVRLRVREGRVRLVGAHGSSEGGAGEQVTLLGTGDLRREALPRAGGEWAWVGEIAPAYDIDNRPLSGFLRWVARETGREIAFASPASEEEAAHVVLRGSVGDLTPERALTAVLATTRLRYSEAPGQLLIDLKTGER